MSYPPPDRSGFVLASSLVSEPVPWLWPAYLPLGAVVMLDGDPGLGKSTIVYDIAARVSTGQPMPDGSGGGVPFHVVIANAEDHPAHVLAPRLDAAGADRTRISLPPIDSAPYLSATWISELEKEIVETGARLLTIDPLMSFVPPGTNTYNDAEIRHVLRPLADVGLQHGCTIILVRHPVKSSDGKALYRGGGSVGIIALARAGFLLARDPDDPDGASRVFAPTKMNLGPPPPTLRLTVGEDASGLLPVVRWGQPATIHADDLMHIARRPARKRDIATSFLRAELSSGPVPSKTILELADDEDIAEKTLRRAARDLGVVTARVGGSHGHHVWSLPDDPEMGNLEAEPVR